MMDEQKIRGILGLCMRAGKLKTGTDIVEQTVKRGGAHLALVDEGMAPRGRKAIADACAYANCPVAFVREDLLGDAIGKPGRMAACVMDAGFAGKLMTYLSPDGEIER